MNRSPLIERRAAAEPFGGRLPKAPRKAERMIRDPQARRFDEWTCFVAVVGIVFLLALAVTCFGAARACLNGEFIQAFLASTAGVFALLGTGHLVLKLIVQGKLFMMQREMGNPVTAAFSMIRPRRRY